VDTNTLLIPSQLSTETAEVATNIAAIESTTGPIVSTAMSVIDSFHNLTALPWWATIATVGFGIRTAMLPISLKGMKASAALFPLLQQARAEQDEERNATTAAKDINSAKPTLQNYAAIANRFHELRLQQGAPHPFWIIGSPLLQLPVFITAMASIRSMALQHWPGFDTGGTAWFSDLTAPALDFTTLATPMGIAGVILPLTVAVAMYANIDAAFGSATTSSQNSPSVMLYVMGKVRLALEWAVIPLFVTSLQLPHGAVCYWVTSSLYALGQNHTLRVAAVRQALGLGVRPPQKDLLLNQGITTHAVGGKTGSNSSSSLKKSNSNDTKQASMSIDTNIPEDTAQGFARAAELRATGDFLGAANALKTILETYPDQPRALFALGQVLSGLKDWGDASHAYLQAARFETEPGQECRAWFGAGVALHMSGREEDAVEAFTRAASPEADEKLRVRAWVAGATLEEKLGRRSQAVALLEQAAEIEPRVAEIYLKPLLEGKMDVSRDKGE
jgi:membrane protein insertase Oxa1/YidC/SpoIIIJ